MIQAHLPLLIPLTLLFFALLIPLFGTKVPRSAYFLALSGSFLAFLISLYGLGRVATDGAISYNMGGWAPPIGIEFILDPLSSFMMLIVTGISFLVIIYGYRVVPEEHPQTQVSYFSIVMLMLTGFSGIVLTGDLFNLYVFLEIASLASYAIVALGDKRSLVASFRYLMLGSLGSAFYLLGIGFIYFMGGSLNMKDVSQILPFISGEPAVIAGLIFVVTGIALKMALFPLHFWLPDAYSSASSVSVALLAPLGTKIGAYILIRFLYFIFEPEYVTTTVPITSIISWLSVAGIIYGSIMAIAQDDLKRMLAYSSVAQVGYIGLGVGLATPLALTGALLHIMNHSLMKAALFLVAGNLQIRIGHSNIQKFNQKLRHTMPWSMAAFSLGALSMIGIPPTAGFFSKWYLIVSAVGESQWFFVFVILLSSLLNAVYFFRVIEKVYLSPSKESLTDLPEEEEENKYAQNEVSFSMLTPTLILSACLLVIGILNYFIVNNLIDLMIPSNF